MDPISREVALEQGKKRFFTGIPCAKGHVCERLVKSKGCVECNREKGYKFRKNNPNYHAEYSKVWDAENADRSKELNSLYYDRTKHDPTIQERRRQVHSKYRAAIGPATLLERWQLWSANNPGKVNSSTAKRRAALLRAIPAWADLAAIKSIYDDCWDVNTNAKLAGCTDNFVVDHIIPLQGETVCGLHTINNLRIIPAQENASKLNKLLEHLL